MAVSRPHTHEHNGAAECKHGRVVETSLTLLAQASVPFRFCSYAFSTTCFLVNRHPTRLLQIKTPLELLLNEAPDYSFLKVFGCACWPHTFVLITVTNWSLGPKSVSFSGIVLFIKGTNAYMFHLIVFIFLVMPCLMRMCFHLPHFQLLPSLQHQRCIHLRHCLISL